jgi:hypothetical protein
MAEYKLGRLRFIWKGTWTPSISYLKDDVIRNGGKTYICVVGHTSSADFTTDKQHTPTKWDQVADGTAWRSDWAISTYYNLNDVVKYGGKLYICIATHTSAATTALGLEANTDAWSVYATGFKWQSTWTPSTHYKVNEVVKYGATIYICNTGHNAAITTSLGLEADQEKWDVYHKGVDYLGQWADAVRYKVNDIINYGADVWICTAHHTSTTTFAEANWARFVEGLTYENTWSNATTYQPGDLVGYGGFSYISKTVNLNKTPTSNTSDWGLFTTGFTFIGDWTSGQPYVVGDVLRLNGYTYVVTADHTSSSGNKPPNLSYWSRLNSGIKWVISNRSYTGLSGTTTSDLGAGATFNVATSGTTYAVTINNAGTDYVANDIITISGADVGGVSPFNDITITVTGATGAITTITLTGYASSWSIGTSYVLGDTVNFGANSYICVAAHVSATGNSPADDISAVHWNLLTSGATTAVLTTAGDIPYFGLNGPTRLPIGDSGQVLKVSSSLMPVWGYFGIIDQVFYVAPSGVNTPAPTFGTTIDQPWLTVRYAAEQVELGPLNPNAKYLLDRNRAYIQKEMIAWIDHQITNDIAPFSTSFTYNAVKCERDIGYVIDALSHDISHGGNVKTVAVALSYVSGSYTVLSAQTPADVACYTRLIDVINAVISNGEPDTTYQSTILRKSDLSKPLEDKVNTLVNNLIQIIINSIADGTPSSVPTVVKTTYTIFVKTGIYYESLPIIVPENCAIVGDELRSTNIRPAGSLIALNDKAKSVLALTYIKSLLPNIIAGITIPTPYQSAVTQIAAFPAGTTGSDVAVTSITTNVASMYTIVDGGLSSVPTIVTPDPVGYNSGFLNARRLINANTQFIKDEVTAYMDATYNSVWSSLSVPQKTACIRDIGYIIDALKYDLTYGTSATPCNLATVIVARSYYTGGSFVEFSVEKDAALAVQTRIKAIIADIAKGIAITATAGNVTTQDVSGTAGSSAAGTFAQGRIQEIYDTINTGTTPAVASPSTAWVTTELTNAFTVLQSKKSEIQSDALGYVIANNPGLAFTQATCSRDVGYMVDALGYDMMFGSNFLSCWNAMSYYRAIVSTQIVLNTQKAATLGMLNFLSQKIKYIAANDTKVHANILLADALSYMSTETEIPVTGRNSQSQTNDTINGAYQIYYNADFLAAEAVAYVNTFNTDVTNTATSTNNLTCTDTGWMVAGDKIKFTGTTFGGIVADTTYYIHTVVSGTTFKITESIGGTVKSLTTATGTMNVAYSYNSDFCARDMKKIAQSVAYDIIYTGNYKTLQTVRYYLNGLHGSLAEDMFYVRNSTGIRNLTVQGLTGTLGAENSYGTKRPSAGAFVSLDPGWGANDDRVWITARSPYIQNVTTFGSACVGLKIDGMLHNGGNRSVVANDFTQIISDGIGVWCTGPNSLTELVSVFSYYGHMGYLAEHGGKIRATNGNSSYGTFGTVAEGVDITEIPLTAAVNNRSFQALITNVITNVVDKIYRVEYLNAGTNYNSATFSMSGSGYGVVVVGNEFRDNAVYETRLLSNGSNYVSASNVGQSGSATSITIAAVDSAISSAYVGMKVQILSGTGVGQFAYITSYNSGSKVAIVAKDNFITLTATATELTNNLIVVPSTATLYVGMPITFTGTVIGGLSLNTIYYIIADNFSATQFAVSTSLGGTAVTLSNVTASTMIVHAAGWEHVVSGTPIAATLDVTSAYIIEPRVVFSSPSYSNTATTQQNRAWIDVVYGDLNATYTGVSATGGAGALATFTVVKTGTHYDTTLANAGTGYVIGNLLTINGTSLGGIGINNITITVTNVGLSGDIVSFTSTGYAAGGRYVGIANSGTSTQYSTDGTSWATGGALSTSATWTSIAYGLLSGVSTWIVVQNGTADTSKSNDGGTTWTSAGLLSEAGNWSSVAYGNSKFIAIASGVTTTNVTSDGTAWIANGALPSAAAWTSIAYGAGIWVAVSSGGTVAAYSTDDGVNWTSAILPVSGTWSSVTFGNSKFVAVASGSTNAAYSLDGINWYTSQPLPASQAWSKVRYGQGLFFAVSTGSSIAATSEDGISWTSRALSTSANWASVAFGNPHNIPYWVAISTSTTTANFMVAGATAKGRVKVTAGAISEFRIVEPGSSYLSTPTLTITDSNATAAFTYSVRTGIGVLANPTFVNRGTQYTVATAQVIGNGYADMFQTGNYVNVTGLSTTPVPGSNIVFDGDPTYYKLVSVLNFLGSGGNAPYSATLQISPPMTTTLAPAHTTNTTLRLKYSQVRLTGHDFLNIGTGNFSNTNFPGLPALPVDTSKQTVQFGGGRVFFTSTDQDGNFNVGNLFSVQQSTGVATLNADAFNIAGLNQLTLGAVTLGGTSATITSFSTDPYFTLNSDNVVPTQKAIKSYISSQIGGGGSSLNVNTLTAGVVYIAGNTISTTTGAQINVSTKLYFIGGVDGSPLALSYFLSK